MERWMNRLARQHRVMKRRYPKESLIVVFDIDDTILDLRHMILNVLASFDRCHDTGYFRGLSVDDIGVGETEIHRMMAGLWMPEREKRKVVQWFAAHAWSNPVVRHAHRPFPGAMDVIRWLQSQENTFVGLNTGRIEAIRKETILSLNTIGRAHGVLFRDDLLFMNRYGWGERVTESKVQGMRYFQEQGLRIVGFVDNEPENLQAVAEFDGAGEILLLHADTVYSSDRGIIPARAVSGRVYDIGALSVSRAQRNELGEAA
ncbi:MAG TPA: hypothetical protein VKF36_21510 [Syntrophorhabdales bacterium]|nr:hypothetical protein [Syntrophorhabdales bacterium]